MLDELLQQLYATPPLDWVATGCSLVYVLLAARDNNWCWGFAAVGSLVWAHQVLVVYGLYSDALLQVFYFVMAGVGIYRWRRKGEPTGSEPLDATAIDREDADNGGIQRMRWGQHGWVLVSGLLLGYGLAQFALQVAPDAAQPYLDGITSSFSVLATFLLVARQLENWLYFIVIDGVYVFIYASTGAYLYLLIMLVYIVVAVYGYRHWRRLLAVDGGNQ